MKSTWIITAAIGLAILSGCAQSEVVWEKMVKRINKAIGEYDIKIKQHEKAIAAMRERYEQTIYNKHFSKANAEQWEQKVQALADKMKTLSEKKASIEAVIAGGAPYKGKSGTEYTEEQIKDLLAQVNTELTTQQSTHATYGQFLQSWQNLRDKSQMLQEQTKTKMMQSQEALRLLRSKIELLKTTKQQVELTKTVSDDVTLTTDNVLNEIQQTDIKVGAEIAANNEMLDELLALNTSGAQLQKKLADF